jgi:hypothetical protein
MTGRKKGQSRRHVVRSQADVSQNLRRVHGHELVAAPRGLRECSFVRRVVDEVMPVSSSRLGSQLVCFETHLSPHRTGQSTRQFMEFSPGLHSPSPQMGGQSCGQVVTLSPLQTRHAALCLPVHDSNLAGLAAHLLVPRTGSCHRRHRGISLGSRSGRCLGPRLEIAGHCAGPVARVLGGNGGHAMGESTVWHGANAGQCGTHKQHPCSLTPGSPADSVGRM